ncbi:Ribosomal protein L5 (mitochondrion) [Coccomyxa sp. Obi]|nr:Ribosomal protein L5 [Coccomyxa sp. Obi]
MNSAKTEYKNNYQPVLMQPLPVVEQLNSAYSSSVTKWQMLNIVSNGRQSLPVDTLKNSQTNVSDQKRLKGQRHSIPRIERFYKEVVCFDLLLQCPLKGVMELSPPKKIVLNSSSKKIVHDKKELIVGLSACLMISGRRCQTTRARKSIAGFKLREGSVLGCKVTLRGSSMYAFLDKLINLVLPRARPSSINGGIDLNGTYNIGISDPFLFVELEYHYDLFQSLEGFDIALVMSPRDKGIVPLFWSGLQTLTG